MPARTIIARKLPEQPPLTASAEVIALGAQIYGSECAGCHGKDGIARVGGSPPDLRYADAITHAQWHGIVIGGARRVNGMPGFELSSQESESVRAYVLSRANALRRTDPQD